MCTCGEHSLINLVPASERQFDVIYSYIIYMIIYISRYIYIHYMIKSYLQIFSCMQLYYILPIKTELYSILARLSNNVEFT